MTEHKVMIEPRLTFEHSTLVLTEKNIPQRIALTYKNERGGTVKKTYCLKISYGMGGIYLNKENQ